MSQPLMIGRRRRVLSALGATALILGLVGGPALAEDEGELVHPVDFIHNNLDRGARRRRRLRLRPGPQGRRGDLHDADPDGAQRQHRLRGRQGPHNETSIAVNPTNSLNMIGGANDYQLAHQSGRPRHARRCCRAPTSRFDGGQTWTTYPLDRNSAYQATGDPGGRVRCGRPRLLRDARLPVRRARSTPRARTSSSPTRGDGGKTWNASGRRGQRQLRQRRRPARQGVRRRVGRRQRDRHLRRLPARPEGLVHQRQDLRLGHPRRRRDLVDAQS